MFLNSEHHQVQGVSEIQTCGLSIILDLNGKKRGDIPWKKSFVFLKVYWNKSKLNFFLHKPRGTFEGDNGCKFLSMVNYPKNFSMVINRSLFYCKQSSIYWASQRSCTNQHFTIFNILSKTNWKWKSNYYILASPIFCIFPFPRYHELNDGVGYFTANQK